MMSFRDYLDYSQRYLLQAQEDLHHAKNAEWLLIPATILAWSSIECFVNNMLDDFSSVPPNMFELHERAFLLEKRIRFVDNGTKLGQFELAGTDYRPLEEKIFFLLAKVDSSTSGLKGTTIWQDFNKFKNARDSLVHPRRDKDVSLRVQNVEDFIETSKKIITLISQEVWKKSIVF